MRLNVSKAFTYVFEDKRWLQKTAPLVIVILAFTAVRFALNLGINISSFSSDDPSAPMIVASGLSFLLILAYIPVQIYISGYSVRISQLIYKNKDSVMPEHTSDYPNILKLGIFVLVANLVWGIASWLVIGLFGGIGVGLFLILKTVLDLSWGVSLTLVLIPGIIIGIALLLLSYAVHMAVLMNIARTGDLVSGFRVPELINIIRTGAGDILVLALVLFGIALVAVVVFVLTICLFIFVQPVLQTYLILITAHLTGQTMRNIFSKMNLDGDTHNTEVVER